MSPIAIYINRQPILAYLVAIAFFTILGIIIFQLTSKAEIGESVGHIFEVTKVHTPPKQAEKVCLDPGHGGRDVGASYGQIYENEINLEVALKTKSILEDRGFTVYMTREDDSSVAKRDRAKYCNSVKADILVSIHHNSYQADRTVDYSTTLYFKDSDQSLASNILITVSDKLGTKNQGISKFDNSLLWVAEMPAALSEAFFLTSRDEYSLVTSANSSRLSDEAEGIASGIVNYFTNPELAKASINDDSLMIDRTDFED
ncbi:MAG: N-acetylmuramoyl-L-alanine amidase [Patescibacteria group bacterium]